LHETLRALLAHRFCASGTLDGNQGKDEGRRYFGADRREQDIRTVGLGDILKPLQARCFDLFRRFQQLERAGEIGGTALGERWRNLVPEPVEGAARRRLGNRSLLFRRPGGGPLLERGTRAGLFGRVDLNRYPTGDPRLRDRNAFESEVVRGLRERATWQGDKPPPHRS
jgi:hypothetical protein